MATIPVEKTGRARDGRGRWRWPVVIELTLDDVLADLEPGALAPEGRR